MAAATYVAEHDLHAAVMRMEKRRHVLKDFMNSQNFASINIKGTGYPGGRLYTYDHAYLGVSYPIVVAMYTVPALGGTTSFMPMCSLYLNNISERDNVADIDEEYDAITGEPTEILRLGGTYTKMYCIELLEKIHYYEKDHRMDKNLWLNYAQQHSRCRLPSKAPCVGLRGIFGLIESVLTDIGYDGPLFCEDDSQYRRNEDETSGPSTLLSRVMNGKRTIYETHGFSPVDGNDEPVSYAGYLDQFMHFNAKIAAVGFEGPLFQLMARYARLDGPKAIDEYNAVLKEITTHEYAKQWFYDFRKVLSRMKCADYRFSLRCVVNDDGL